MSEIPETKEIKFIHSASNTYSGQSRNGLYHGEGQLVNSETKNTLNGHFVKGDIIKGNLSFEDGSGYQGKFSKYCGMDRGIFRKGDFSHEVWRNDGNFYSNPHGKMIFGDGDSFTGSYNPKYTMFKGTFNYPDKPEELIEQTTEDYDRGNKMYMKEGHEIRHFKEGSSFKQILFLGNDYLGRRECKITFKNGDFLTGRLDSKYSEKISFYGTLTYFDERYPPYIGAIIDNKPISGSGICYLYNTKTKYEGDFYIGGSYTKTDEDGTVTTKIVDPETGISTLSIIYANGKKFKGEFKFRILFCDLVSGTGYFPNAINDKFHFEGEVTSKFFRYASLTNKKTGTKIMSHSFNKNFPDLQPCQSLTLNFRDKTSTRIKFENSKLSFFEGEYYEDFEGLQQLKVKKIGKTIPGFKNLILTGEKIDIKGGYKEIGEFTIGMKGKITTLNAVHINSDGSVAKTENDKRNNMSISSLYRKRYLSILSWFCGNSYKKRKLERIKLSQGGYLEGEHMVEKDYYQRILLWQDEKYGGNGSIIFSSFAKMKRNSYPAKLKRMDGYNQKRAFELDKDNNIKILE